MIAKEDDLLGKDGGIVRCGGVFWLGGQESPLWRGNILAEPGW